MGMTKERSESEGGLGKYSPEMFADLDMADYRKRFPNETAALSDERLFHAVSNTEDDMSDDEWRKVFAAA
jgi:hypothetical protein